MGVNEHGVAIGNEAVFTRAKKEKAGLIGMDLLRLALERADSAESALKVITDLLAEYGQGGNCGYTHEFRYDNSYLIADPTGAFVLETAGRAYAAVPVEKKAAISNRLRHP
jgi:dipeptidase